MSLWQDHVMRCVGYIRVSTEKQSTDGYSLDAQSAKIRALAMLKGYDLIEIVADDESAKDLKRPGVQRVIQMVKAGHVDAVLIMKLDRFTRSVKDLAEMVELFNRRNVALVSLTESIDTKTAAGELSMNITTSVSQWERRAIGERTRAALDYKRSIGERLGNVPYGYQAAGAMLEPNAAEQATVRRILALKASGATLRTIAATLNAEGLKTRRGSDWRNEYVHAIVKAATVPASVAA